MGRFQSCHDDQLGMYHITLHYLKLCSHCLSLPPSLSPLSRVLLESRRDFESQSPPFHHRSGTLCDEEGGREGGIVLSLEVTRYSCPRTPR